MSYRTDRPRIDLVHTATVLVRIATGHGFQRGVATLLADEFFLIAHEERTGRSRLHPRATGLGLAAALIGELILMGRVGLADGDLYVLNRNPPTDALAHEVLELLLAQPQHRDLGTWLAFLAQDSAVKVGERLSRAGTVEPVTRRRLMGSHTLYMPMSADQHNTMAWAPARLADLLVRYIGMDIADRTLAGLVLATGLTRFVLWDLALHRPGLTNLHTIVDSLPAELRQLVDYTQMSVGYVLAVGRR